MATNQSIEEAVELLQQLGLQEYEARCFVGLSRLPAGTAKELSEITEVPRTRVYDAIRVLESQGLVEIQHSSPQQFRAVPLEEAAETLRDQYATRVDRLAAALDGIEPVETSDETEIQEVWALSDGDAIENRTVELVEEATDEIVLVIGHPSLLTEDLAATLADVGDGVELVVGALTDSLQEQIQDRVPVATTFVSGLEWLQGANTHEEDTAIGRLMLVDQSTILVSTIDPDTGNERAIFGRGFENGLVVVARRLMAQGLLTERDPN